MKRLTTGGGEKVGPLPSHQHKMKHGSACPNVHAAAVHMLGWLDRGCVVKGEGRRVSQKATW